MALSVSKIKQAWRSHRRKPKYRSINQHRDGAHSSAGRRKVNIAISSILAGEMPETSGKRSAGIWKYDSSTMTPPVARWKNHGREADVLPGSMARYALMMLTELDY